MHTTDKFPQKARFTYTDRLVNLALSVVEDFIEARYSRNKIPILDAANMKLEKIRIFIRICYEQRYLSREQYEHAAMSINEVGKMLGGWRKERNQK